MQAQLLVGPITPINVSDAFSSVSVIRGHLLYNRTSNINLGELRSTGRHRKFPVAASSSSAEAINGEQNHYAVLGIEASATSADVKKAYRLLARKYHPDVSKDSQAAEVFKTIRHAYEVLSNEATRMKYDRALTFQKNNSRSYRQNNNYRHEYEDGIRMYKWAKLRQRMQYKQYRKRYNINTENSFFYDETTDEEDDEEEETLDEERGSFMEVLKSAFISLFLLKTFGSLLSLTYTSLIALFDRKLDSGYKIGYVIAWILGGRGGVLLTLCLSFASWACGKSSSSVVVLVVVAMWVGSNVARYAPLPQGALLTLLYMSIKLQVDLRYS